MTLSVIQLPEVLEEPSFEQLDLTRTYKFFPLTPGMKAVETLLRVAYGQRYPLITLMTTLHQLQDYQRFLDGHS